MYAVLGIAKELLRNIGSICIDPYFLIFSFLIYYLYKREDKKNTNTQDYKQIRNSVILDILRGVIVGVGVSTIFSYFGYTIVLEGKVLEIGRAHV